MGACQSRAATAVAEGETAEWDEWEELYATDGQARFIERVYRDSSTLAMGLAAEADLLGIRVALRRTGSCVSIVGSSAGEPARILRA